MRTLFFKNTERITEQDRDDMIKYFGENPWNEFDYVETFDDLDVHPETAPILYCIHNSQRLNEREEILTKRIKTNLAKGGLTPSTSYYSRSVEHNLIEKLVIDARDILKMGEGVECVINWYEIFRYYGLEYGSLYKKDLEKAREKTNLIKKPKKFYDWQCYFTKDQTYSNQGNSCYLEYHIDVKSCSSELRNLNGNGTIYKKFPYLGKLYYTSVCGEYLQLYVYDQADRHWAVNNVLDYLVKEGLIKLN